jgi:hypothetical protein
MENEIFFIFLSRRQLRAGFRNQLVGPAQALALNPRGNLRPGAAF